MLTSELLLKCMNASMICFYDHNSNHITYRHQPYWYGFDPSKEQIMNYHHCTYLQVSPEGLVPVISVL